MAPRPGAAAGAAESVEAVDEVERQEDTGEGAGQDELEADHQEVEDADATGEEVGGEEVDELEVVENPDPEPEPPRGQTQQRQGGRRENAVGALRARTRAAEEAARQATERAQRLEERLDREERTRSQPPRESAQQRAERLAMLSPEERYDELRREDNERHAGEIGSLKFTVAEASDKTDFRAACRENPYYARVKDEVETRLQKFRSQGFNYPREVIAKLVLGEQLAEGKLKPSVKQRARVQEAVDRNTVRLAPSRRASAEAPAAARRRESEDPKKARYERIKDVGL